MTVVIPSSLGLNQNHGNFNENDHDNGSFRVTQSLVVLAGVVGFVVLFLVIANLVLWFTLLAYKREKASRPSSTNGHNDNKDSSRNRRNSRPLSGTLRMVYRRQSSSMTSACLGPTTDDAMFAIGGKGNAGEYNSKNNGSTSSNDEDEFAECFTQEIEEGFPDYNNTSYYQYYKQKWEEVLATCPTKPANVGDDTALKNNYQFPQARTHSGNHDNKNTVKWTEEGPEDKIEVNRISDEFHIPVKTEALDMETNETVRNKCMVSGEWVHQFAKKQQVNNTLELFPRTKRMDHSLCTYSELPKITERACTSISSDEFLSMEKEDHVRPYEETHVNDVTEVNIEYNRKSIGNIVKNNVNFRLQRKKDKPPMLCGKVYKKRHESVKQPVAKGSGLDNSQKETFSSSYVLELEKKSSPEVSFVGETIIKEDKDTDINESSTSITNLNNHYSRSKCQIVVSGDLDAFNIYDRQFSEKRPVGEFEYKDIKNIEKHNPLSLGKYVNDIGNTAIVPTEESVSTRFKQSNFQPPFLHWNIIDEDYDNKHLLQSNSIPLESCRNRDNIMITNDRLHNVASNKGLVINSIHSGTRLSDFHGVKSPINRKRSSMHRLFRRTKSKRKNPQLLKTFHSEDMSHFINNSDRTSLIMETSPFNNDKIYEGARNLHNTYQDNNKGRINHAHHFTSPTFITHDKQLSFQSTQFQSSSSRKEAITFNNPEIILLPHYRQHVTLSEDDLRMYPDNSIRTIDELVQNATYRRKRKNAKLGDKRKGLPVSNNSVTSPTSINSNAHQIEPISNSRDFDSNDADEDCDNHDVDDFVLGFHTGVSDKYHSISGKRPSFTGQLIFQQRLDSNAAKFGLGGPMYIPGNNESSIDTPIPHDNNINTDLGRNRGIISSHIPMTTRLANIEPESDGMGAVHGQRPEIEEQLNEKLAVSNEIDGSGFDCCGFHSNDFHGRAGFNRGAWNISVVSSRRTESFREGDSVSSFALSDFDMGESDVDEVAISDLDDCQEPHVYYNGHIQINDEIQHIQDVPL